eukprot:GFYU01003635.1.p3 GENE.GFYU01003635.1~~GFYU01003635.1.p3  ORF type:complete len:110 (+),score=42.49 GFYU01003635.1:141-470(+)
MTYLDPDAFLTQVTRMFERSKMKGSVHLTMKRFTGIQGKPMKKKDPSTSNQEPRCLIRASDGNKTKLSTLVTAKELVRFQISYGNILKVHIENLKKKEKAKRKSRSKNL